LFNFLKEKLPLSFRGKYRRNWKRLQLETQIVTGGISRIFHRLPLPENPDGSVNLHLGCGEINHPKFINIDAVSAPHIHYVRQIDDLSLFKDDTVDFIYASHCLEHFSHKYIHKVLAEWYRSLKKGGVLRLSVPDFDSLLDIYMNSGNDINRIIGFLMGAQNYKYNFHRTIFTKSSLSLLLKNTGFVEVKEWTPFSGDLTTFSDCSRLTVSINGRDCPVSLNLEAVK